jgi:GntR family transcriptional regulator
LGPATATAAAIGAGEPSAPGSRPLYAQVRDILMARIGSGAWRPGEALPSEQELGRELGVSQGTVRKALDALASERIVVRRQGSGTFVHEQTAEDVLFRYFQIFDEDGRQIRPEGEGGEVAEGSATRAEAARLGLEAGQQVIRLVRVRCHVGRPLAAETIVVPAALFPGLARLRPMPGTLYDLFQRRFGVTVARADERLTAVAAAARIAERLRVPAGTPLLRIDRTAFSLGERPVEWRISFCHLAGAHYRSQLR